jgi:hypothetical protein
MALSRSGVRAPYSPLALGYKMKVVHCKKEPFTIYIGRPSVFGNPFVIGRDGTREDVISKYEIYARQSKEIMSEIERLPEDAILACWCSPKPCHGDILVKIWKELKE